jgi:tRNA-dihydrouridine synthase
MVRQVKAAVDLPVIVNGDIVDNATAATALRESGADGVMIGRGAIGRPWLPASMETCRDGGGLTEPRAEERVAIIEDHLRASIHHNGRLHGVRLFRKHLAAYVEAAPWSGGPALRREAKARLCRMEGFGAIIDGLCDLWSVQFRRIAA